GEVPLRAFLTCAGSGSKQRRLRDPPPPPPRIRPPRVTADFGKMGRGVSSGGGQSSLGYLFGSDGAPKSAEKPAPVQKPMPPSTAEKLKDIPAGIQSSRSNNYIRAEGQNCGNFLTDRPSTKVQAAPGGGSSLDYLFSGSKDSK
ncbi:unnamed protein product, partial [Urochloa humidicola]